MTEPCCLCGGPGAVFYECGARWQHIHVWDCIVRGKAEVQRLRSRERRVVRVFWRVRHVDVVGLPVCKDHAIRKAAFLAHSYDGGKVYRVTVRRVAKAGRE